MLVVMMVVVEAIMVLVLVVVAVKAATIMVIAAVADHDGDCNNIHDNCSGNDYDSDGDNKFEIF